ncbi:hypothetical protein [Senegalia massiliensis]|nr:hypothetical protein [Senegalia massiliensis]
MKKIYIRFLILIVVLIILGIAVLYSNDDSINEKPSGSTLVLNIKGDNI